VRKSFSVVALALVVMLGSYSLVKGKDAPAAKPLRGKVTAVAKDAGDSKVTDITVSHGKKGEAATETVVKADDSTKVTKGKDGAATLTDIVVGSSVSVVLGDAGKPAVSIEIRTPKKPAADIKSK
jgi:hypothetical protein